MPVMEMVLVSEYFEQLMISRWNYIASGTPAAVSYSFALASAAGFIEDAGVFPPDGLFQLIRETQTPSVEYDGVIISNVYDVFDFYSVPYGGTVNGVLQPADEGLSPATAIGYRTNRVRKDIRRGFKRLSGISAGQLDDGGQLNSPTLNGKAIPLANKMSEVLTYDDEGNTLTFAPCIISKERVVDPETGKVSYRYYETEAEQEANAATGILWSPYSQTRTQVSRQYGRGQ